MATLTAVQRRRIPTSKFAGAKRSYPVEDRSHAANAKGRAKQQLNRGDLSQATYRRIVTKANRVLGAH